MVEKFCGKDAKKSNFSEQMEFRKRSIMSIEFMNQVLCTHAAIFVLEHAATFDVLAALRD